MEEAQLAGDRNPDLRELSVRGQMELARTRPIDAERSFRRDLADHGGVEQRKYHGRALSSTWRWHSRTCADSKRWINSWARSGIRRSGAMIWRARPKHLGTRPTVDLTADDPRSRVAGSTNLASVLHALGDTGQTTATFRWAYELQRSIDNIRSAVIAGTNLGEAEVRLGRTLLPNSVEPGKRALRSMSSAM